MMTPLKDLTFTRKEAKRVLEQVAIAESSVERLRLAPAGTLRISAPTSFGACVIAPLTASFLQAWPDVRIELDLTNRMIDLVDEGFDLAIRIGDIHHTDLVAKYLCPYRMVICAAPAYLARHGTPVVPADLVDHRCLSHTVWTARNEWTLPGAQDTVRWKRDAILRCNDGYGLCISQIAPCNNHKCMKIEALSANYQGKKQTFSGDRKSTRLNSSH